MRKYFVSFYVEDGLIENDIIEYSKLKCKYDIEELEISIAFKWYGDDRKVKIINFREI